MKFVNTVYFKILTVLFLLFLVYQECFVKPNKDFDIFIEAAKLISAGQQCYDLWLGQAALKYYYSPLFGVLLFPFTHVPQIVYNLFWLICNFFFIYRSMTLLKFYLPLQTLSNKKIRLLYALCILSCARFIMDNLDLGQMTPMLLWGTLESVRLIYLKKIIPGAGLLALIINIKIIPVAVLAYLVYKREYRATALVLVFSLIYLFLPAIVIGYGYNNALLMSWYRSISGTHANSIAEDAGRPSLSSLIPALFSPSEIQFGIKRNFVSLPVESATMVLNISRVLLLLILACLFGRPFQKIKNSVTLFFDISLVCLATPLVFPHQGKYSILYLLPAYAYTLFTLIHYKAEALKKGKFAMLLVVLSFILCTLTTDGLIGRRLSDACEYLHLITYGTFCLLAAMVILRPERNTVAVKDIN
jgi:hypothetical protein